MSNNNGKIHPTTSLRPDNTLISGDRLLSYGVALFSVGMAVAIGQLLNSFAESASIPLFFMAVMVSAWYGGLGPGLVATVLSTLAINIWFESPYYSLLISDPESLLHLTMFFMVALLTSGLNQSRRHALHREQRLRAVSEAAQQEIQAVKERLETVLSSISDGVCILDREWRYTYANDRYCQMAGMRLEDLLGQSVWELFPAALGTELQTQFQRVMVQRTAAQFEYFYTPWGRWYEHRVYPCAEGMTVFIVEVTAYKESETALRESEAQLRLATEGANLGMWYWDVATDTLVWTDRAKAMFGLPIDTEMSMSVFLAAVHPDDQPIIQTIVAEMTAGQTHTETEYRTLWADGTIRWIMAKGDCSYNADGELVATRGVLMDITDRKQAEASMRESGERYRYLANSIPQLVWLAASDGTMLDVNQRWLEYTGISLAQVRLGGWSIIVHPDDITALYQSWAVATEAGTLYQAEGRIRRADGVYRWHLHQAVPQTNDQGQLVQWYGTATDIHDRKQAQLHDQFLNDLDLQLRQLSDAHEMMWQTVSRIGQYLEVDRCTFAEIDWQQDRITIERDWCQAVPSIVGTYSISDFITPAFQSDLAAGQVANVPDVRTDPGTAAFAENYEAFQIRAYLSVPCIHQGEWSALLSINSTTPRVWHRDEVAILQETVVRLWSLIEQTRAVQALHQSEALYRALTELLPQMVYMSQPDGVITYCNQWGLEYTGRTLAELQGNGWLECIHPDCRDTVCQIWATAIETSSPYEVEFPFRRGDGVYRWFYCHALPIRNETGAVSYWLGVALDISDRKQAELEREQLLTRERQYAEQLQGLTAAALAINSALTIQEVLQVINNQAAAIIGSHQAVTSMTINQDWAQAINTMYLSEKYSQWWDYNASPTGNGIYACVCHLNRPMRLTQAELEAHPRWRNFGKEAAHHPPLRGWLAAPLVGRDGNNIGLIQLSDKYEGEFTESDEAILVQLAQMASVAIENTRLYEAEQQARSAAETSREEAHTANQIKDEFLAVLSHELRSPLNPILGWARLLQTKKMDAEKTAQALATIERNARLQAELIEDLLDVSRILRGKLVLNVAPVNLAAIIEAAKETVRLAAEAKGITIQIHLPPQPEVVSGDAARLQQVVWNLLSNAVKFTPTGGQVEVRLEHLESRQGIIEQPADSPLSLMTAHAQIIVSDTGKGINPEFLPHVFDYFRQEDGKTTRKFGGLGLGLAIARHLVELHGGTIQADSVGEDLGATFTVTLPLLSTQSSVDPTLDIRETSSDLNGLQVLVVDDDTDTRDFIGYLLEQAGANVTSVNSAREALRVLDQFHPDVLLSDIGMPEMDGYMLMQQVRSQLLRDGRQMAAIALTAYAGEFNQQQALQAGFQKHLSKPVEPGELIAAITELT